MSVLPTYIDRVDEVYVLVITPYRKLIAIVNLNPVAHSLIFNTALQMLAIKLHFLT
jgi:hypothetical protein